MKRCPSCREFIGSSAHTCPKCGANDPFRIVEKESSADEIAAHKASMITGRKGSGPVRTPMSFKENLFNILLCCFYIFIAFPLFISDIHTFFKVILFIICVPLVIYIISKSDY